MNVNVNFTKNLKLIKLSDSTSFNGYDTLVWMENNWTISIYASIVYVILIFAGQKWMENRRPFDLKMILTLWNFMLAAFSIMAFFNFLPLFRRLISMSYHQSVCTDPSVVNSEAFFWAWLYVVFKLVELGDTAFIVLRKKKLIFLHWYHHITVMVACWHGFKTLSSVAGWFGIMNSFVHGLMYTYYGVMAMGIKVPKPIAMSITVAQIVQMGIAVVVSIYAYLAKVTGNECHTSYETLFLCFSIYLSYLILFANYFHKAYVRRQKK